MRCCGGSKLKPKLRPTAPVTRRTSPMIRTSSTIARGEMAGQAPDAKSCRQRAAERDDRERHCKNGALRQHHRDEAAGGQHEHALLLRHRPAVVLPEAERGSKGPHIGGPYREERR